MQYVEVEKLVRETDRKKNTKTERKTKKDKRILNKEQLSDLLSKLHKLDGPNTFIGNNNRETYCQCTDFCEKCQDNIKMLYTESLIEIIDEYEFVK